MIDFLTHRRVFISLPESSCARPSNSPKGEITIASLTVYVFIWDAKSSFEKMLYICSALVKIYISLIIK